VRRSHATAMTHLNVFKKKKKGSSHSHCIAYVHQTDRDAEILMWEMHVRNHTKDRGIFTMFQQSCMCLLYVHHFQKA
jgi:hypothetical protein